MAPVLDIVVDEREIVDKFHSCCGGQYPQWISSYRLATEKMKDGTNEFACLTLAGVTFRILPAHMISQNITKRRRGPVDDCLQLILDAVAISYPDI
jgi:hypothetical protein